MIENRNLRKLMTTLIYLRVVGMCHLQKSWIQKNFQLKIWNYFPLVLMGVEQRVKRSQTRERGPLSAHVSGRLVNFLFFIKMNFWQLWSCRLDWRGPNETFDTHIGIYYFWHICYMISSLYDIFDIYVIYDIS